MDKKIFDIIPPSQEPEPNGKAEEKPPVIELEPAPEELLRAQEDIKPPQPGPSQAAKKKIILLSSLIVLVLAAGVSAFVFLPIVKIQIWLKTETLNTEQKIQVSKKNKGVDIINHSLFGRIITEEQTVSQDFKATGKAVKEVKAEGIIRIFNNYSSASQPLLATTRFVSDEGKLFRLVEKVVVPGQTTENGKTVPGYIDAVVRADVAGPDYNIGPATFSIPGFAGTSKYTAFYAQSFSAMSGGFKGDSPSVSELDLENARTVMIAQAKEKVNQALAQHALPGLVLAAEKNPVTILDDGSDVKAGQAAETFKYEVKAKGRAILLAEDDLKQMSQAYFLVDLPDDQKLVAESVKTDIAVEGIDENMAAAELVLQLSGKVYQDLQESFIRNELKGKSVPEVEKSFQELSQVSRAQIKIFPSLVKKLPQNDNKIQIKLNFD